MKRTKSYVADGDIMPSARLFAGRDVRVTVPLENGSTIGFRLSRLQATVLRAEIESALRTLDQVAEEAKATRTPDTVCPVCDGELTRPSPRVVDPHPVRGCGPCGWKAGDLIPQVIDEEVGP